MNPTLGYVCKYVPVEVLKAAGINVRRIEPQATDFCRADTLMHANVCSFVRAVLEDFADHDYDGMILTTCCDSTRRLFDTLRAKWPDRFFYCLDLPHKINDFADSLYAKHIKKMLDAWNAYAKEHAFQTPANTGELLSSDPPPIEPKDSKQQPHTISVGLVGARPGDGIRSLLISKGIRIRFDMTCTGAPRNFDFTVPDNGSSWDPNLPSYAHDLLNQIPCMRMADASGRQRFLQDMSEQVDGIIYHTIKFCDIYSYEYTQIHKKSDLPILKIETDATDQSSGQILTRLEAFIEALEAKKQFDQSRTASGNEQSGTRTPADKEEQTGTRPSTEKQETSPMIVMGIDSGSTSTNAVLLNEKKEILASAVLRTGARSGDSAERVRAMVLEKAGLTLDDISLVVSTGYGRVSIPFADKDVTEISCHAKGAHFLNPQIRTILDIGGQDSKAIHLDDNGNVKDFVMNDKCAAGTGRFLEMMARTLEIPIEELGPLSLKSSESLTISSMCTVFAESEVISLIAQNKEPADIAHGIHEAIVSRAMSLIKRVGAEPGFMMTGGVAKNEGVVDVLQKRLNASVWRYEEPEIVGALGAALFGLEE
ncbi:MAG: 2-hydroxyacyl-CoA dehydratase [Eubacterium sp.]|nr:2-hydroxyacyl-CoA dehydratase [Eubacterium sp.]